MQLYVIHLNISCRPELICLPAPTKGVRGELLFKYDVLASQWLSSQRQRFSPIYMYLLNQWVEFHQFAWKHNCDMSKSFLEFRGFGPIFKVR